MKQERNEMSLNVKTMSPDEREALVDAGVDLKTDREYAVMDIAEQVEWLVGLLVRDLAPEEAPYGDEIALDALLRVAAGMRERGTA